MHVVDGSYGEGGGQVVRTALAVAMVTGEPVRVIRIRSGRPNPGLAAQHLATLLACQRIVDAEVTGARLGSLELTFAPRRRPHAGEYTFDIGAARQGGSAGSATLLAQTIALPLSLASDTSTLEVRGGTYVPWSPTADYLAHVWTAALERMGFRLSVTSRRPGWYPAGGGRLAMTVAPATPRGWNGTARGELRRIDVFAVASRLPAHVATRLGIRAQERLRGVAAPIVVESTIADASSPGAALTVVLRFAGSVAGFSALGERGLPAELVADSVCDRVLAFLGSGATVDEHLADQLLLPAALAGTPTSFVAPQLTGHLATNAHVLEAMGQARVMLEPAPGGVRVSVRPRSAA